MNDIFNISSKNSYLTTKQWEEVVEYVKNRKNIVEEPVVEEVVEEETVEIRHSDAYEQMVVATSVEEMYMTLLDIMMENPEKLYQISSDELQELYDVATQMNEENPSGDYQDLADTLQYLAGDYDLNGAEVLIPTGYTQFTLSSPNSNGYLYSGKYYLNSDIVLEKTLIIPQGETVYLDLNGFVLSSPSVNSFKDITHYNKSDYDTLCKRVILVYGSLIIEDSNPTKINKGSIKPVSRWIDKRLDASKLTQDGKVYESVNTYTDRYYWDTTDTNELWIYDKTGLDIIKGGIITGGMHTSGAGIYVGGGNLTINGGNIVGNRSIRYVETASDTKYQTAYTGNGGGIYATAYGTSGNSNYRTSTVTMNGGSVCYNWCDYLGGGFALNGSSKLHMNHGKIYENCAQGSGGGLTVRGDSSFYLGNKNVTYTEDNVPIIQGNRTYSTRYHGGGAGIEVDGGKLEYNIGKIIGNRASGSGGGIYCYRGGSVNAKTPNSIISDNIAASGAGIYLQYGDIILDGCIVENNRATSSGGAIGLRVGNFSMINGRVCNNYAGSVGGAIYTTAQNNFTPHCDTGLLGCNVSIKGTLIDGNQAGDSGGAFYVSAVNSLSDISVDIISSTITNNKAGVDTGINGDTDEGLGGAIYLSGGILTIGTDDEYGEMIISGNTADGGGAFYIEDRIRKSTDSTPPYLVTNPPEGAVLDETGSYYNKALTRDHITAYDDTKIGRMIINGGTFLNNNAIRSSGGVAYLLGKSSHNNEHNVEINSGVFDGNNAATYGGAIYVDNGDFIMFDGKFINNTAEVSGGSVYITNGNVDIKSGIITNNIALDCGGAIAVASGDVTIGTKECHDAGESSAHIHPVIESNIASDGGGIYVDGGITTMWCGDIRRNLTYDKTVNVLVVSGGNFVYNGGTIGVPYDTGVFVNGGIFEDNSSESEKALKHELHYHSVLGDETHNGKIPESKWIASPRGDILNKDDCDYSSVAWGDLYPKYEFVGWESHEENDTNEVVNLYAIWEEK